VIVILEAHQKPDDVLHDELVDVREQDQDS
jgi:hypothetical protein